MSTDLVRNRVFEKQDEKVIDLLFDNGNMESVVAVFQKFLQIRFRNSTDWIDIRTGAIVLGEVSPQTTIT